MIVYWTAGVSKLQFIKVILGFSLFFMVFQIIMGSYISPIGQDKARNFIRNSNIDFFPSLFQEGKFIDVVQNLTIFIESEKPSGTYNNIYLKEMNKGLENSSRVIYAKKGYLKNLNDQTSLML